MNAGELTAELAITSPRAIRAIRLRPGGPAGVLNQQRRSVGRDTLGLLKHRFDRVRVVLLALLVALMWSFGALVGTGIDHLLVERWWVEATLPGIELAIVPLAAIAAAPLRFGADRILALRAGRAGPLLPLLMAAALFGLAAYLLWTWVTPRPVFAAEPDFGVLRWLGIVLAAGFAWLWMPLFPRITAILAGLIAGPALFAIIGCTFFGFCMPAYDPRTRRIAGGGRRFRPASNVRVGLRRALPEVSGVA